MTYLLINEFNRKNKGESAGKLGVKELNDYP